MLRSGFLSLVILCTLQTAPLLQAQVAERSAPISGGGAPILQEGENYKVIVSDSLLNVPIQLAMVTLRRDGYVIAEKVTNQSGLAVFTDVADGAYSLFVHSVGYNDFSETVKIDKSHLSDSIGLTTLTLNAQVIVGQRLTPVTTFNLTDGTEVFSAETYHAPPSAQMTTLVQENLMGAARAPTGEVHIRGQHGEYEYFVDGLPVPLGVFGGLNDIVDPKVIDRAVLMDGGWPAEYGGQVTAVIDLQNRVPPGGFHLDASTYGGSYYAPNSNDTLGNKVGAFKALNSNGQSLSLSDHIDNLGIFLSGTRQETDRRIDPPVSQIFHDHGFDYFLYGKLDYTLSDADYLTANLNKSKTYTQVPYDSAEGIMNDLQNTSNSFQTLSYYHTISTEDDKESNLFAGVFAREGGLVYTPGPGDPTTFQFPNDTTGYVLAENRSFTTLGTRIKYDDRLSHHFMYAVGMDFSSTTGKENFTSQDSAGNSGPVVNTKYAGSDFGVFAESEIHPLEWTRIELGVRYDQHIAPDMPLQKQVSPRIKWNVFFDESNSAYLYYGRLFMPTNIEGLRTIEITQYDNGVPTLPERDDFYEAVYIHDFGVGLRSKADAFYKYASPGVDDETVGASAIKTPVNIQDVHTTGIELGFSYNDPSTPFSGYINSSIIHAYGQGLVTGGFLPISTDGAATDLDHDQRLSIVASVNYQPAPWYANLTGIYGSGLTNGNPNNLPYQTGLFDFNTAEHTTPSWILNVSGGYTFYVDGGATLEPSLYVTNLFDHIHLIKGAYFSGASWEEPRNVVFKISYHI
jgi:hypothetical protein